MVKYNTNIIVRNVLIPYITDYKCFIMVRYNKYIIIYKLIIYI